ncbi:Na+/H+ antiporter family protein [Vibrio stylophorae]|nr:Na+/H+ antiporter NhaC family protein [Vibrio stylophorae]
MLNPVLVAVMLMLTLALLRVNVVIALTLSAIVGGLVGQLSLLDTVNSFQSGLKDGASIALGYAMLGTFAVAISRTGITDLLARGIINRVGAQQNENTTFITKYLILVMILAMAIMSQNAIPVHIAFIPILIPPLLHVFSKLKVDRRLVACVLTFGLVTTYMALPIGFGGIFLGEILMGQLAQNGLGIAKTAAGHIELAPFSDCLVAANVHADVIKDLMGQLTAHNLDLTAYASNEALMAQLNGCLDVARISAFDIIKAMALPATGMIVGLLIAVFISYRKPRTYSEAEILKVEPEHQKIDKKAVVIAIVSIAATLGVQLYTNSMIVAGLVGFLVFTLTGVIKWADTQDVFSQGLTMMAMIGFIMISANGFAAVMKSTGGVETMVALLANAINSKAIVALLMLVVGLLVTMGIGSSFSTIPVLATIYVPLCMSFGFSIPATIAIIGTAGALGDAGSPASDSTLGPTSGLNADGQHDHIWDTVVPTFIHYNIPLIIFGWIAAMVL